MTGFGVIEVVRIGICCFSQLIVHIASEISRFVEVGILIHPFFLIRVKQLSPLLLFLMLSFHLCFYLFLDLHLELIFFGISGRMTLLVLAH